MGGGGTEAESATALNSGAVHLLRAVRRVDREAGLPPAQLSALSVLVFGGPLTLGALAAAEDVAGPTMTRIVDGLVARELAERQRPADRRQARVVATPAGRRLMQRARRRRVEVLAAALAALPAADRRRLRSVGPLLDRLAAEVRARTRGPGGPNGWPSTDPAAGGRRGRRVRPIEAASPSPGE